MKRTQIYKGPNVTFDPKTKKAYSYGWWLFLAEIEGVLVFNNYSYSPSTTKHQYKLRALLRQLNIKIDIEMPIHGGLSETIPLLKQIEIAETEVCEKFWAQLVKNIDKAERKKNLARSNAQKYLDTHIKNLSNILGVTINLENLTELAEIELTGHSLAEKYCNGDIDSNKFEELVQNLQERVRGIAPDFSNFVFNADPRGYFLKIDDAFMRKNNYVLEKDFGGYGIVVPSNINGLL